MDMPNTAIKLVRSGYNIIFVNESKMPIGITDYRDFYDKHMTDDFIKQYAENVRNRASGIALLGNVNPNYPEKRLVIIDVDDPWTWDEVLNKLEPNLRQKLEESWKWLTGPRCPTDRDKHGIKCVNNRCKHNDHEFDLPVARRGLAYAVLVPRECMSIREGHRKFMGGAVELRIRAYELTPPSRHPSGVNYEWVNPPFDASDPSIIHPPQELTCEEVRQLLTRLGTGEVEKAEAGGLGRRRCIEEVIIPEDRIVKAVELIKDVYIPGHRDSVLFGLIGSLWYRCVSYESARKLVDAIYTWASQVYEDESEYKDYYTLDWIYGIRGGGEERRVWGRARLYDALVELYKSKDLSEIDAKIRANVFVNELFETLGIKRGTRVMVEISADGKVSGRNTTSYVANDPKLGIIILYKRSPSEKTLREYAIKACMEELGEEGKGLGRCIAEKLMNEEFRDSASRKLVRYGHDKIVRDWYISKAVAIEDPYTGNEFYTITFRNMRKKKMRKILDKTFDELVKIIIKQFGSPVPESQLRTYLMFLLTEMAKKKKRPTFTGIVYDKGVLKIAYGGPYKKNMKELMNATGDAKAFINLVRDWYNNDPRVWDAFAMGLFQIFNFTRKQANVTGTSRNKALVLAGEPKTGKSTIAEVITGIIYNHSDMMKNASILFSPARLARYASRTTVPLLVNDAKPPYSPSVVDVIKSLVTEDIPVYELAIPYSMSTMKYMGVSGLIITSQRFIENDPGILERIYKITFTASDRKDDRTRTKAFEEWLSAHGVDLMAFGRLYIETAINEWGNVRSIILNPDYIEAAREYLTYVLSKLGVKPVFTVSEDVRIEDEPRQYYVDEFRKLVRAVVDEARGFVDSRDKSFMEVLDELVRKRHITGINPILDEDVVVGYKVRRDLLSSGGVRRTDIDNLIQLHDGLRRELSGIIPCVNEHLEYSDKTKDKHGMYMYVSKALMGFIMQEIEEVLCNEEGGNEEEKEGEGKEDTVVE